jgi:hypothetical protein
MNNKTPTTFNEVTKSQNIKAEKEKENTGKVKKIVNKNYYKFLSCIIIDYETFIDL